MTLCFHLELCNRISRCLTSHKPFACMRAVRRSLSVRSEMSGYRPSSNRRQRQNTDHPSIFLIGRRLFTQGIPRPSPFFYLRWPWNTWELACLFSEGVGKTFFSLFRIFSRVILLYNFVTSTKTSSYLRTNGETVPPTVLLDIFSSGRAY